jgi:hypothetical protein
MKMIMRISKRGSLTGINPWYHCSAFDARSPMSRVNNSSFVTTQYSYPNRRFQSHKCVAFGQRNLQTLKSWSVEVLSFHEIKGFKRF